MESTFITIHDLSRDARILYASDSIADILGYSPQEATGKSCWEYFHPEEIPFAREVHGRGVKLDKAAVLAYCQIKNKDGQWVGCECCFTIAYDVLVACTSIYRHGAKSEKRAVEAPIIRRMFSSSPKDPRYHMLTHLSTKFSKQSNTLSHEPRATLFLNRFTRTLTIMYVSNAVASVLGISAEEMRGKSFYYCIQERCLREAIKCLESAKANDSIAYLRFWFRDPREETHADDDTSMEETSSNQSSEDEEGGVHLEDHLNGGERRRPPYPATLGRRDLGSSSDSTEAGSRISSTSTSVQSHSLSSGNSTDLEGASGATVFDQTGVPQSSTSSLPASSGETTDSSGRRAGDIELEAVVSCTSDGLVVILRRARPAIPDPVRPSAPNPFANGLFASPWTAEPILPSYVPQPQQAAPNMFVPAFGPNAVDSQGVTHHYGSATEDLMNSIREIAVFAWALTGINGCLTEYTRGKPTGFSQPPDGFPVWVPDQTASERIPGFYPQYADNTAGGYPPTAPYGNNAVNRWAHGNQGNVQSTYPFGVTDQSQSFNPTGSGYSYDSANQRRGHHPP
ncbi:hypothetical protein L228DRAFT_265871 [Xylona heveae TC161]|uniref:PAS domain-containing protein n=1 Tax=Xylona heveae (strain CBS 132557 / TC161) TaxID=1328760 RepID=A0A165IUE4_XYLHT|nr:hypothetical protein L228DRAFT_265871 [Xylona heveae TC161]KZF25403.1 hypothetical protein L228DRAFT_265871 [Xylona heveae TC161]